MKSKQEKFIPNFFLLTQGVTESENSKYTYHIVNKKTLFFLFPIYTALNTERNICMVSVPWSLELLTQVSMYMQVQQKAALNTHRSAKIGRRNNKRVSERTTKK